MGGVLDQDAIVLDAYRLARFYRQNPAVFLDMPLSEVQIHMVRTIKLARIMRAESARDDE